MQVKMKNKNTFALIMLIFLITLILSSCGGASSTLSYFMEQLKPEKLDDKAFAYMVENYGDIFEKADSKYNSSTGRKDFIVHRFYVKVIEHPYDRIEVRTFTTDEGRGEIFQTDYPHFLFGNEAGIEWEKMLNDCYPRMGYLPPLWEFTKKEGVGRI